MAKAYNASVILHTDHCSEKLTWIDGLLEEGEKFYKINKHSLYSSHMIDLSDEPIEKNIQTCKDYLQRMSKIEMTLEIELVTWTKKMEIIQTLIVVSYILSLKKLHMHIVN